SPQSLRKLVVRTQEHCAQQFAIIPDSTEDQQVTSLGADQILFWNPRRRQFTDGVVTCKQVAVSIVNQRSIDLRVESQHVQVLLCELLVIKGQSWFSHVAQQF